MALSAPLRSQIRFHSRLPLRERTQIPTAITLNSAEVTAVPQPKSSPLLPFPVVPARPIARYLLECSQPGRGENENPLLSWLVRASCAGPLVAAGPPSPIVVSEAGPDDRAGCFQYALCTPPACR